MTLVEPPKFGVVIGGIVTPQAAAYSVNQDRKSLDNGGGPPHDGGMEARMAAVERRLDAVGQRLDRMETRLDSLDDRLRGVEAKLSEIGGKIDILASNMSQVIGKLPTWWQMPAIVAATAALVVGIIKLFAN